MELSSIKNKRKIDRFDIFMNNKGLNDNKVTIDLSLSVGTLGKSRKQGRDLSDRVIELILNFYSELNRIWLLTGEGEMLKSDKPKQHTNEPTPDSISIPREVFDQISKLTETVLSQQRTIEKLTNK